MAPHEVASEPYPGQLTAKAVLEGALLDLHGFDLWTQAAAP